jgi:hypothetical protein
MAPRKVALRPVMGFITPEAVGAYDPHPTPPGLGEDPLLELDPLGPVSLKPAEMMMAPSTPPPRTRDDVRHRRCGSHDHREVHLLRHLRDRRVGLDAEHVGPARVDRKDRPPERARDEVPHDGAPHAPGPLGGPDDRHRLGRKIASSEPPSYPRTSCAGSPLLDRFIGRSSVAARFWVSGGRPRRLRPPAKGCASASSRDPSAMFLLHLFL